MTCVQISIQGITTMDTNKRRTPTRTQLSTPGTDLGSIVRFNLNNFNTFHVPFVFNKGLQLKKTPITNPIVHSLSSSDFSNPFKVFHYNFVSRETRNNFIADVVINPSHKPFLPTRDFFKQSLRGLCAFCLEFTSQEFEFSFMLFNLTRIKELFIGSDSEIINPQVNSQNSFLQVQVSRNILEECKSKVIISFKTFGQETFSQIQFIKILQSITRNINLNFNSSTNSPNTQDIIRKRETSRSIISDRGLFNKRLRLGFFKNSTSHLDTGSRKLSRKSEISQFGINKRMQFNIIFNSQIPTIFNTILKSLFIEVDSINDNFSNFQFNRNAYLNLHNYHKESSYLNVLEDISPPKPEGMGIRNVKPI